MNNKDESNSFPTNLLNSTFGFCQRFVYKRIICLYNKVASNQKNALLEEAVVPIS